MLQQDPLVRGIVQRSRGFVRQSQEIHVGMIFYTATLKAWNYSLKDVCDLLDEFEVAFAKDNPFSTSHCIIRGKYYRHDIEELDDIDFIEGRLKQIGRSFNWNVKIIRKFCTRF